MHSNNTLAAKEQVAVLLKDTWLVGDLPKTMPECFVTGHSGLSLREGFIPTKEDFEHGTSMLSAMLDTSGAIRSSLNLMLGDLFRMAEVHLGMEEADRLRSDYLHDRGRAQKLVHQIKRVCEAFPDPESRGNLEYTHLENLLPWKKRMDEGQFEELVEWAKDGESVSLGGVGVMKMPKSCATLRTRLQELSGRGANVRATVSDPTGDAAELKLAREVCKSLREIRDTLQARWIIFPRKVVESFTEWEVYCDQRKENLS